MTSRETVTRMTPRRHFDLYLAACAKPEVGGGIYHYSLEGGRLEKRGYTPVDRPMYLAVEEGKLHVLLRELTEGKLDSGYMTYDLAADGSLENPSAALHTEGRCACHLWLKDGKVYIVNYLSGNVVRISDGAVDKIDTHEGSGVHPTRQEAPHTHFVRETPDGKYLLAVDLGIDTIFTYDSELNVVSTATVPAGEGCRHLDYSPDGRYVYCANELGSSVTVFAYDDGKLTRLETYPALPADFDGQSTAAAIRVSEDGKYLYVSHRGHDSVCAFDLCGDKLANPVWTKICGISPRDFLIVGDILVATNEKTDNATLFRVEGKQLTKLDYELPLPGGLCVVAK